MERVRKSVMRRIYFAYIARGAFGALRNVVFVGVILLALSMPFELIGYIDIHEISRNLPHPFTASVLFSYFWNALRNSDTPVQMVTGAAILAILMLATKYTWLVIQAWKRMTSSDDHKNVPTLQ